MGTNKTNTLSPFALAVRAEILAEMGRRQISVLQLTQNMSRGKSYLYERLSKASKELTLGDIEEICVFLSIPIGPLMDRAEQAMGIYSTEQTDYALAAKDVYTREGEDGIEYYEG